MEEIMPQYRPLLKLLQHETIHRIIDSGWQVLAETGVIAEDDEVVKMARKHGAGIDASGKRLLFNRDVCEKFIQTAPKTFTLFNRDGAAVEIGNDRVTFDPGSAAVFWQPPGTETHRRAQTPDCIQLAHITDQLSEYALQATGIVPSDVPEQIADCHRLAFALIFCSKPIVTGTFRTDSFPVMKDMLEVISGSTQPLRKRPNAVFDCCPSPPLKWSRLTLSALMDCAVTGLPAEIVSMPLAGATAPVTLMGSVIQHTAEALSGVILHQMAGPGSPIIWGGSPAAFDMRHGTPPMGAIETMMIDLAYTQVGKHLGLPTHAYMACSDSKSPDYQAGLESGIGAVLAALGAVNIVSGPGFLNYENTQSLEKLILDHEAVRMAQRLIRGIEVHPESEAVEIIRNNAVQGNFLSDPSTRKLHRSEISRPGKTIFRGSVDDWTSAGCPDSRKNAQKLLEKLLRNPPNKPDPVQTNAIIDVLLKEADRMGFRSRLTQVISKAL